MLVGQGAASPACSARWSGLILYGVPGRHHGLWDLVPPGPRSRRSGFLVDPLRTVALGKALSSQGWVIKGKTEAMLHGPGGGRLR